MSKSMTAATLSVLMLSVPGSAFAAMPNPSAAETQQARQAGPCGDPWVSLAVSYAKSMEITKAGQPTRSTPGRAAGSGSSGECNPAMYRGGHWANYNELLEAVLTYQHCEDQTVRNLPDGSVEHVCYFGARQAQAQPVSPVPGPRRSPGPAEPAPQAAVHPAMAWCGTMNNTVAVGHPHADVKITVEARDGFHGSLRLGSGLVGADAFSGTHVGNTCDATTPGGLHFFGQCQPASFSGNYTIPSQIKPGTTKSGNFALKAC